MSHPAETMVGAAGEDEGTFGTIPVAALIATSVLAQIGQYGIGFVVLPLWLMQSSSSAALTGLFASFEWIGMLAGIMLAPSVIGRSGFGRTVFYGLLVSAAGFCVVAVPAGALVLPGAGMIGFGMGLRWIGIETPLFRGTPSRMRGRIIGLHELLVASAAMIGPMFERLTGLVGVRPLMWGVLFVLAAMLSLIVGVRWSPMSGTMDSGGAAGTVRRTSLSSTMRTGAMIGATAGLCNGALYGLLPQFAHARAMTPEMTSSLLVNAGIGAALAQYPVGWLADRLGLTHSAILLGSISLISSTVLLVARLPATLMLAVLIFAGVIRALLTLATYAAAIDDAGSADHNMRVVAGRFSVGAILGPIGAGTAMTVAGMNMLAVWFIALCGGLTLYLCSTVLPFMPRRSKP